MAYRATSLSPESRLLLRVGSCRSQPLRERAAPMGGDEYSAVAMESISVGVLYEVLSKALLEHYRGSSHRIHGTV